MCIRDSIPPLLDQLLPSEVSGSLSAGLLSASAYIVMALVLLARPRGLLPARA